MTHDLELTYAVTIYAVLPTIVIVLLFSFLTDLDRQVAQYEGILVNNRKSYSNNFSAIRHKLRQVDKFIIVSSRYLHLAMSFYLIFLISSFLIEILPLSKLTIINIAYIIYLVYAIIYTFRERTVINKLELNKKALYYGIHFVFFFLLPFLFLCTYNSAFIEKNFYIIWITTNLIQIALWWLIFPAKDKPLNTLNEVSKEILNLNLSLKETNSPDILNFIKEFEECLKTNWSDFNKSTSFDELKKIHNILVESNQYSRENRCASVPYPPYHLGAQIIGKGINEILIKYKYMIKNNFPGLIENSEEYETTNGHMIRKFKLEVVDCDDNEFSLFIEFEHSHDEYKFISSPKVYIK